MKIFKKGTSKRVTAFILSCVLTITALPVNAFAAAFSGRVASSTKYSETGSNTMGQPSTIVANSFVRVFPATKSAVLATDDKDYARYKYQSYALYFCVDETRHTATTDIADLKFFENYTTTVDSHRLMYANSIYAQGTDDIRGAVHPDNNGQMDETAGTGYVYDFTDFIVSYKNPYNGVSSDTDKWQGNFFLKLIEESMKNNDGTQINIFEDPAGARFQEEFDSMTGTIAGTETDSSLRNFMYDSYLSVADDVMTANGKKTITSLQIPKEDFCLVIEPVFSFTYSGEYIYETDAGEEVKTHNGATYYYTPYQQLWVTQYGQADPSRYKLMDSYYPFKVSSEAAKNSQESYGFTRNWLNKWTAKIDSTLVLADQIKDASADSSLYQTYQFYVNACQANFGFWPTTDCDPRGLLVTFIPSQESLGDRTPQQVTEEDEVARINGGWGFINFGDLDGKVPLSIREYRVVVGKSSENTLAQDSNGNYKVYYDGSESIIDPAFNGIVAKLDTGIISYYRPTKETVSNPNPSANGKTTGLYINETITNQFVLDTWSQTIQGDALKAAIAGAEDKTSFTTGQMTAGFQYLTGGFTKQLNEGLAVATRSSLNKNIQAKASGGDTNGWGNWGKDEELTPELEATLVSMLDECEIEKTVDGKEVILVDPLMTIAGLDAAGEQKKSAYYHEGIEVLPYINASEYLPGSSLEDNATRGAKIFTSLQSYQNPYQPYILEIPGIVYKGDENSWDYAFRNTKTVQLQGYDIIINYYSGDGTLVDRVHYDIEDVGNTIQSLTGYSKDSENYGSINLVTNAKAHNYIQEVIDRGESPDVAYAQMDVRAIYSYYGSKPEDDESKGYVINLELPEYMSYDVYENIDIEHTYDGTSVYDSNNVVAQTTWGGDDRGHTMKYYFTEKLYRPTDAVAAFNKSEEENGGCSFSGTLKSEYIDDANRKMLAGVLTEYADFATRQEIAEELKLKAIELYYEIANMSLAERDKLFKKIVQSSYGYGGYGYGYGASFTEFFKTTTVENPRTQLNEEEVLQTIEDVLNYTILYSNGNGLASAISNEETYDVNNLSHNEYVGAMLIGTEYHYNGLNTVNKNDKDYNAGSLISLWDETSKTFTIKCADGTEYVGEEGDSFYTVVSDNINTLSSDSLVYRINTDTKNYLAYKILYQCLHTLTVQKQQTGPSSYHEFTYDEKRSNASNAIKTSIFNLISETLPGITDVKLSMPRNESKFVSKGSVGYDSEPSTKREEKDAQDKAEELLDDLIESGFVPEDIDSEAWDYSVNCNYNYSDHYGIFESGTMIIYLYINAPYYSLTKQIPLEDKEVFESKYVDYYEYVEEYAKKVVRKYKNYADGNNDYPLKTILTALNYIPTGVNIKNNNIKILATDLFDNTRSDGVAVYFSSKMPSYSMKEINDKTKAITDLATFRTLYDEKVITTASDSGDYFAYTGGGLTRHEAGTISSTSTVKGDKTSTAITVELNRRKIYEALTDKKFTSYMSDRNVDAAYTTLSTYHTYYNENWGSSVSIGQPLTCDKAGILNNRMFYIAYQMQMANDSGTATDKLEVNTITDWVVQANGTSSTNKNKYDATVGGAYAAYSGKTSIEATKSDAAYSDTYIHNYSQATGDEQLKKYTIPSVLPIGIKVGSYYATSARSYVPPADKPIVKNYLQGVDENAQQTNTLDAIDNATLTQLYSAGSLTVVPEIPMGMGYTKANANGDFIDRLYTQQYVWGTQPRTLESMVYNTIDFDVEANVKVQGVAVANDSRAAKWRKEHGINNNIPVLYSGSELTVAITPKSNSTIKVSSYMLTYVDNVSENQSLAYVDKTYGDNSFQLLYGGGSSTEGVKVPAWAKTYKIDGAAKTAFKNWLELFDSTFTDTAGASSNKKSVTLRTGLQVNGVKLKTFVEETIELEEKNTGTNSDSFAEWDYVDIIIGNKNGVATILNLYQDVTYDGFTYKNISLADGGSYLKAIKAMQLEDMVAATFEVGTGTPLGMVEDENGNLVEAIKVDPYVARSAQEYADANAAVGVEIGKGWYTEVVRTLRILKGSVTYGVQQSSIFTDKIPISYGPKSPTNKNELFTTCYKGTVYTQLLIPKLNATRTIRGTSSVDFLVADATVNDMKFGG